MESLAHRIREKLSKVPVVSTFTKTGTITVEEFICAGDLLVSKFPSWAWADVAPSKRKKYLPAKKQFLICHRVPSLLGVNVLPTFSDAHTEGDWIDFGSSEKAVPVEIDELSDDDKEKPKESIDVDDVDDIDDIDDVDDVDDIDDVDDLDDLDDVKPVESKPKEKVKKESCRLFDVSITYCKEYRVPRFWIQGFDEDSKPLANSDVMSKEINKDYAGKTVTAEPHPFSKIPCLTVHPCRHGQVMKAFYDQLRNEKGELYYTVDVYLILFLKFVGSVAPAIQCDFTTSL
ncbi:Ubiquitin-like-conjugating enzyme Atg3/Atg10 like protein [Aduncisulcus paluster]|uniref:Ubiquitin-like-conjugating enzyme Atg3/Atg10 like protein n=1 Tax=Aduncisulcus paluster TaxID=2918883 RepID=A0ABQ5JXE2_9EUKA|nr:Ubiquitin-like-conjugating enzyme Atg3/Atg10 like protein [Aduncisulcus paluster]|eukprot:gnl/Carplike_NY0171/5717_a7841_303.p1 GENE.gnl/Carplike_NY0171/5717_a7841_303~~gnl/Carplike_NY0171/5717_a7841_303.p1  ORF type:complete len:288 (-),score=87.22 gnl/Carplike_NY0171/5717_a7841_303:56-919(-)